jgi:hypothetical protein
VDDNGSVAGVTWVKIDDRFSEHPKLAQVGPLGWGIWLAGLAYCNRNETDGFIPRAIARSLADFEMVADDGQLYTLSATCGALSEELHPEWVAEWLVKAALWEPAPGGYRVHDYGDYQFTKAENEARREQRRSAGQAGGQASAKARAKQTPSRRQADAQADAQAESNPVPVPVPKKSSSLRSEPKLDERVDKFLTWHAELWGSTNRRWGKTQIASAQWLLASADRDKLRDVLLWAKAHTFWAGPAANINRVRKSWTEICGQYDARKSHTSTPVADRSRFDREPDLMVQV